MANYAVLKAAIENVIKPNGNNEITGQLLQNALIAMIESLGVDCQFAGVATPETNPGTPDQNVMYIAGAGTYPNFGPTTVKLGEIGVFTYKGSWQYVTFPTDTTNNVVNINQVANHPSYYTTLQDAFADVPERYRKPGCITSFYLLDEEGVPMRVAMMYIGDDTEDWEDADYWLNMGPVYLRQSYDSDDYWVLQIGLDSNFKIIDTLQSFAKSHVLSANQGRILNEKIEGYEIEVASIGTTSEILPRPILQGSIITKIDGATKLIFGSNEVVTTADLPYKMQNVANAVKTESGTVTYVTIGVRGVVGVDFINVNDYYGHSAAFESALLARTEVAATERKKGLYITYLLADGWHIEQFIGSDISAWVEDDNWKNYNEEIWNVIEGTPTTEHITESLEVTWAGAGAVVAVEDPRLPYSLGEIHAGTTSSSQHTDYIDISAYASKNALITYLNEVRTNPQADLLVGLCFYDAEKLAISGVPFRGGAQEAGTEENTVSIPANAAFVRFSIRNEHVDQFTATVEYDETVYHDGLLGDIAQLQGKTDDLQEQADSLQEQVGTSTTEHITESLEVTWAGAGAVVAVEDPRLPYSLGEIHAGTTSSSQHTDYIDISAYASKNALITYLNEVRTNPQADLLVGLCFYDAEKLAISGVPFRGGAQEAGTEENTVSIPANAAFVRFSIRNEHVDQFTATVEYDETVSTGLKGRVEALEEGTQSSIVVKLGHYINSSNGDVVADEQYNCTEFIAIKPFDKFAIPTFVIARASVIGLAFYDGYKHFVSGIHCPYDAPAGYTFERYVAPPNAVYLRYTLSPNVTPYLKIESQEPIAPYFKSYKAFNTVGHKGGFHLFMNFGNGIMLGSCGNNKLGDYDNILIYRSTDWGFTWTLMGNATQESTLQLQDGLYYGDHDGQGNAVVGSGDLSKHYLLKITNYGATWPNDYKKVLTAQQIDSLLSVSTNGVENVIYCGNNTYRALCNSFSGFSNNNAVIESTDGGNTWHTVSSQSPLTASVRTIFRDSKGAIWAAGMLNSANQGVWKTEDNGLTWERKSTFLSFQSITEHKGVLYSGAILANTTEAYIYRSRDNGNTWEKVFTFNDPTFSVKYHRGFISYGNALIAIFGEGEGSTSTKIAWIVTTDDGNHWGLLDHNGSFENGYASLALTIGQTNYINTHSGLFIM